MHSCLFHQVDMCHNQNKNIQQEITIFLKEFKRQQFIREKQQVFIYFFLFIPENDGLIYIPRKKFDATGI